MGKYVGNFTEDSKEEVKIRQILIWISNELAESNRLKRIKFRLDYDEDLDNKEIRELLAKLEDQA